MVPSRVLSFFSLFAQSFAPADFNVPKLKGVVFGFRGHPRSKALATNAFFP